MKRKLIFETDRLKAAQWSEASCAADGITFEVKLEYRVNYGVLTFETNVSNVILEETARA